MVCAKVRIRFRKGGTLRLVSHHDLMRCFERMLRRSSLPFHSTAGFNPKPRLVFALSLGLGIVGCEEVVELELDQELPPDEIQERLVRQAPAGLEIVSVQPIAGKTGAQVRRVCYRLAVPPARLPPIPERIAAVLAAPHCWVDRTRPNVRHLDLRPYVRGLHMLADAVELDLWVTPQGMARPDEVLGLLGLSDLLDAGAVLERTTLELHDECCASTSANGPPLPAGVMSAACDERNQVSHLPPKGGT